MAPKKRYPVSTPVAAHRDCQLTVSGTEGHRESDEPDKPFLEASLL